MAWCPVCKCEYKKGITKCAECKVELVETLDCNDKTVAKPEEVLIPAGEEAFEMDDELLENKNLHFIDREAQITAVKMAKKQTGVYRNSQELSNENKSSAYILLPVGIL